MDERSSFGHELETAYLLLEATELLQRDDDRKTRRKALELVDHSLRWGWDQTNGGFYDEGPPTGPPTRTSKVWWVQPEGMNGLLTAARIAGDNASDYRKAFASTWQFFRDHMVDHKYGGCYDSVSADGSPLPGRRHKATPWKTAYHVTRAMLFAIHELRHADDGYRTRQKATR
ncbi:MAG: AGE family epimerase/isomerase [Planctomycetes bacterium]|nr:AGE family epimerase/isomerase [Planctomycetota bacterium]MBL7039177.1 AGE family epimerase/isomerase [Pirellulaceae bacterium]